MSSRDFRVNGVEVPTELVVAAIRAAGEIVAAQVAMDQIHDLRTDNMGIYTSAIVRSILVRFID